MARVTIRFSLSSRCLSCRFCLVSSRCSSSLVTAPEAPLPLKKRKEANAESEKKKNNPPHLGRDPLLGSEHDAVAREHAQRRSGVADRLHRVLDLVEPALGREDGRAGVVAPGHGCGRRGEARAKRGEES